MDRLFMKIQNTKTKRKFVPEEINLDRWEEIETLLQILLNEELESGSDLEKWILKINELSAVLHQERTLRYVRMICHTDNQKSRAIYNYFIQEIEPKYKPLFHKLADKLLSCPYKRDLPHERYGAYLRDREINARLFRQENIPLKTKETNLKTSYQQLTGKMTIWYRGKELPLPKAFVYLNERERKVRKAVWEHISNRWLREKDAIEDIFEKQIRLRHQIAANAGFQNYRDYIFQAYKRFNYTPEDCLLFHKTCEMMIMPLLIRIQEERKRKLRLKTLKPFDMQVDENDFLSLKPFSGIDQLINGTREVFGRIDSKFDAYFTGMIKNNLLDLENRKGKVPGSYCVKLGECGLPFIFMNATGSHQDVMRLLHEAGHAFHYLSNKRSPHLYGTAPKEMCELASLGMEFMGLNHLHVFYSDEELRQAKRIYIQKMISYFPGIATIDAFQHWVYTHKGNTPEQRRDYWLELMDKYLGIVDFSDYNPLLEVMYHQTPLLFQAPFYFIEYAIALIGALQVWRNYQKNPEETIEKYLYALSLGGSKPLPELYKSAGVVFGFNQTIIGELMDMLQDELEKTEIMTNDQ